MSVNTSKQVRKEATSVLAELDPAERNAVLAPALATVPAARAVEVSEYLASARQGETAQEAVVSANAEIAQMITQAQARRGRRRPGPLWPRLARGLQHLRSGHHARDRAKWACETGP